MIESSGQWPREVSRLLDMSDNPVGDDYASLSEGLCRDGKGRYVACSCPLAVNEYGEETRDWSKARYGVIDENGALIVPLIYTQYVQVLSADRFWVMTGDGSGMIDAAGKWYYYYSDYNALID